MTYEYVDCGGAYITRTFESYDDAMAYAESTGLTLLGVLILPLSSP